ncbi:uncharacterized protein LOC119733134 [Patiria miniata]|uniref:Uncharacterized protein n=1 Tax=Patiria miniata TaxID=46514 RepID=A0A914AFY1_PATMI|nr:uncharacterized protein LOC119733134 [Patiria miniata]
MLTLPGFSRYLDLKDELLLMLKCTDTALLCDITHQSLIRQDLSNLSKSSDACYQNHKKRKACVSSFPALTKETLLLMLECPETAPLCDDIKHQRNYIQGALGLFRMY